MCLCVCMFVCICMYVCIYAVASQKFAICFSTFSSSFVKKNDFHERYTIFHTKYSYLVPTKQVFDEKM